MTKNRKPDLMERTHAAVRYLSHTGMSAERQAEGEMEAFMALFHPDFDKKKVRSMAQEAGKKARRRERNG